MSENNKNSRYYIHFIEDVLLSITRIEEYILHLDYVSFKRDYKTVDVVSGTLKSLEKHPKMFPCG